MVCIVWRCEGVCQLTAAIPPAPIPPIPPPVFWVVVDGLVLELVEGVVDVRGVEEVGGAHGLGRGSVLVVPWGADGPGLGVAVRRGHTECLHTCTA